MTLNLEVSKLIAERYSDLFQAKSCYENVYKLLTEDFPELSPQKDLRVLFCYAHNGAFYYRHAFAVFQEEIIEPLENIRIGLDASKMIVICELSFKEYIGLTLKDKRFDLFPSLFQKELKLIDENKTQMTGLNPIDLCEIVRKLTKNANDSLTIVNSIHGGYGIPSQYCISI